MVCVFFFNWYYWVFIYRVPIESEWVSLRRLFGDTKFEWFCSGAFFFLFFSFLFFFLLLISNNKTSKKKKERADPEKKETEDAQKCPSIHCYHFFFYKLCFGFCFASAVLCPFVLSFFLFFRFLFSFLSFFNGTHVGGCDPSRPR